MTATRHPDTPLEGPYASRDDCESACLRRTSPETAVYALAAGHLPCSYLPRQFTVRSTLEVLHYIAPPRRTARPASSTSAAAGGGGRGLPEIVYGYTRTALLVLCHALKLPPPPNNANRAAIINHMEAQLGALKRGAGTDVDEEDNNT